MEQHDSQQRPEPLAPLHIGTTLTRAVTRHGQALALVDGGERLTYAALAGGRHEGGHG